MLALRAALAAYVDGWARVVSAPWLLGGLSAALVLVIASSGPGGPAVHQAAAYNSPVLAKLGALLGLAFGGPLFVAVADSLRLDIPAELVLWLAGAGVVLAGTAVDRYARRRPLDARAFFGVSGELAFRLIRLAVTVWLVLAPLVVGLSAAFQSIGYSSGVLRGVVPDVLVVPTRLLIAVLIVGVALAGTVIHDCARVRLVVERRRSALFSLVAGVRFAWRHAGAVAMLYLLLLMTLTLIWEVAARIGGSGGVAAAVGGVALLTGGLVGLAAVTSLFQASLAHAGYVAPPRLVWPDSPAIETLGERRDFPPAV